MSRDPAGHTSNSWDPVSAMEARADMGVAPDCPSAEGSENMSITNSEVESAMNHQRRRAILRDPRFSEEAFNSFSSA